MSPQTAVTVRNMFRGIFQDDPTGEQEGTGAKGAVPGYQLSGKTGTAQQVDPACGCYSNSSYNITFAGIAPADDPRFVVGIMLDNPKRSSDGSGGSRPHRCSSPSHRGSCSTTASRNRRSPHRVWCCRLREPRRGADLHGWQPG